MLNFNVKHHLLLNVKQLFVLLIVAQTNNVAERETAMKERKEKKKNPAMHVMT